MGEPAAKLRSPLRIRLERPSKRREAEFLAAVRRSRALHRNLVSPPRTATEFADYSKLARSARAEIFLIVLKATDEIVGVVHIESISRGASRSANLGYYGFVPFVGRGLMREGLRAAMRYAFRELKLHRLEANVQPINRRSIELIRSLGFAYEGYSPKFMKVAGRWRDHERWAILVDRWRAGE